MNKLLLGIFILFLNSNPIYSDEVYILKEDKYSHYEYDFEPICKSEIIYYEFKNETLDVYSKKDEKIISTIGNWENVSYSIIQLSNNRKKLLFAIEDNNKYSLFLIDGILGKVNYLLDIKNIGMSNSSLEYYIFEDNTFNPPNTKFVLINLFNCQFIRNIYWEKNERPGGGVRIVRKLDEEYDFRFIYQVEKSAYAEAYYSITNDNLKIIYDETSLEYERYLEYEITLEEIGRHNK